MARRVKVKKKNVFYNPNQPPTQNLLKNVHYHRNNRYKVRLNTFLSVQYEPNPS
jgi:hypothetical protein